MPEFDRTSGPAPSPIPAVPAPSSAPGRRIEREEVEMLARVRRGIVNTTVVLQNLTPLGARISGIGLLQPDEVIALTLPECRPMIAFVAWAGMHDAGLEFVHALPDDLYADLVARYGLQGPHP